MNIIPQGIAVYGQDCIGCKDAERDIMLTLMHFGKGGDTAGFADVLLTVAQAEEIIDKLTEAVGHYKISGSP